MRGFGVLMVSLTTYEATDLGSILGKVVFQGIGIANS